MYIYYIYIYRERERERDVTCVVPTMATMGLRVPRTTRAAGAPPIRWHAEVFVDLGSGTGKVSALASLHFDRVIGHARL